MKSSTTAIIGSGPAGCAAAIELARAGREVVLLEASEFPRHRPGESLHPGVEVIFEKLGVAEAVNAAGFPRHRGHEIEWNGERKFEAFGGDERGEWLGYQAWRADLDAILLKAAKRAGARIWQPCRALAPILDDGKLIGLQTDRGEISTEFVLDASGRNQWLSRKLGIDWDLRSPQLTARYGYVEFANSSSPSNPKMRNDADGWTWIAQVGAGRCAWVRLRFDGGDPGGDFLPSELADAAVIEPSRGADVTWRIAEQTAGAGWFLLGDAAAVLDPAASHGVLRALMTGMQAADVILSENVGGAANYHAWLKQWFELDAEQLDRLYAA